MKLLDVQIKVIKDSRKKDTLEAHLIAQEGNGKRVTAIASVPSGKSTGTHEAAVLDPKKAFHKLGEIRDKITGINFRDQREFDSFLLALDGTENKNNLGGNLILSLSLAFARAFAKSRNLPLWKSIRTNFHQNIPKQTTRLLFNVINGGVHAEVPESWNKKFGIKRGLDFQEFQVIPTVNDLGMCLSIGREFYKKLGRELGKIYGTKNVLLGDEAGYLCPFKTNEEALEILQEMINRHLYPLKIGIDAAASQFYQDADKRGSDTDLRENRESYIFENERYTPEELRILYNDISHRYEFASLEDPYNEEAFESFATLTADLCGYNADKHRYSIGDNQCSDQRQSAFLIITDDLTTTNPLRLKKAIKRKSGNAILVKPNQIGTLSETLEVIRLAYKHGWQAVVSHRSGETMDDFIADLAYAVGAWGLKAGAPGKPERLVKYDRLLEIWKKNSTVF